MVGAERIKEEVQMRDLLPRLGFDVPPGRARHAMKCPFHADKSPSAWVILTGRRQRFVCFTCDVRHDVIEFVKEHLGLSFKAACEWLVAEFAINDDPLEEMWKRFHRGRRGEQRRDVGDVTVSFLNLWHGQWWLVRDKHPEHDGDLRALRQVWIDGFDATRPDEWYRRALADLERWTDAKSK